MNIITSKPIIVNGEKYSNFPDFPSSNTGAVPTGTPMVLSPSELDKVKADYANAVKSGDKTKVAKLKSIIEKAQGAIAKGKDSGLFSSLGSLLGIGKKNETAPAPVAVDTTKEEPKKDKTMTYVLIGVGAVAVIGLVVYLAKSSGSEKSGK